MEEKFGIEKELDSVRLSLEAFVAVGAVIPALPDYETIVDIYVEEVVGFKSTMVELTDKYKKKFGDAWPEKSEEIKEQIAIERKKVVDYYLNEGRQFLEGMWKTLLEAFKMIIKAVKELAVDIVKKIAEASMPTFIGVGAPNPLSIILKLLLAVIAIKKQLNAIALLAIKVIDLLKQIGILDLVETVSGGIVDFKKKIDAKAKQAKALAESTGDTVTKLGEGLNLAQLKGELNWIKNIDPTSKTGKQIKITTDIVDKIKELSGSVASNSKALSKAEGNLKEQQQISYSKTFYASQYITEAWPTGRWEVRYNNTNPYYTPEAYQVRVGDSKKNGAEIIEFSMNRYGIGEFPLTNDGIRQIDTKSNDLEYANGDGSDAVWKKAVFDFSTYMNGWAEFAKTTRIFEESETTGEIEIASGPPYPGTENTGGGPTTAGGKADDDDDEFGGQGTANDGDANKTPGEGDNPE